MPPRDPEFDLMAGNDRLTIPCYFAKGYDDPGFLRWRQEHLDWFAAGTWTSQSSANETPQPRSTFVRAADSAMAPFPTTTIDRHERSLAATRASIGKGRTVSSLDPSTISLADFQDVIAAAKSPNLPKSGALTSQSQPVSKQDNNGRDFHVPNGVNAQNTHSEIFSSSESKPANVETVAHTNPSGGVPLVLNDGTLVLDRFGKPMLVPPGRRPEPQS